MDTVSPMLDRRTTKTRAAIFGGVRSVGYANVAKALGISESTFSEWFNKYGDRVAMLLTAINAKPVAVDARCVTAERAAEIESEVERLRYWARIGMATERKLVFDNIESDTGIQMEPR